MPSITSGQNPRLRELLRLAGSSRERRKTGRCVLEGAHLVAVYLDRIGAPEMLAVSDDALSRDEVQRLVSRVPDARTLVVPARLLARESAMPADIGVLAVVPAPVEAVRDDARFTLLVEDVQDPGNVGSMLRTAAAAGVDQVLLSRDCAFAWSPKVLRAAQGAHFLTHVVEDVDLVAWTAALRARGGQAVATTVRSGDDLYRTALREPLAVAIGNEGAGLGDALAAECEVRVTIPMAGGNESLNAAAAAAVVLFEAVRQRRDRMR
jgi:TrmH family RNA methyltransferase